MRFGLYARITLGVAILFTLAMLALGFYLISDASNKFRQERLQQVKASAKTLANGSRDALVSEDYELLEFWLQSTLVSDYYAYAYLSRADGMILSHTDPGRVATKSRGLGELDQVLEQNLQYQGRPVMELVYPARLGNRHLANAHVAYFLDLDTFGNTYNITNIIVLVIVLLGSILIATLLIVRRYTAPISRLTDYVTSLSLDDIHNKLDSGLLLNRTEVGELTRAFDGMAMRLLSAFRQLKVEEQHLKELVEKRTSDLSQANMELEAFSYSVSHDLRAPLRTIDGFTQILQEDYAHLLDEDGQKHMQRIRAGARRMGELIDDLLELSRISRKQLQTETIHIGKLASNIAENLEQGDKSREVEFVVDENLSAEADSRLMQIALENLIGNAWKYTSKVKHAIIEFGMRPDGSEEIFYVRDNGIGFDMAYADKLFKVFNRLHQEEDYEGTGIGLATVDRIIRRHGGRVWAESEPGKGATFYFILKPSIRMVVSN